MTNCRYRIHNYIMRLIRNGGHLLPIIARAKEIRAGGQGREETVVVTFAATKAMTRSIKGNAGHKYKGYGRQIFKDGTDRFDNAIRTYPQILLAAIKARHNVVAFHARQNDGLCCSILFKQRVRVRLIGQGVVKHHGACRRKSGMPLYLLHQPQCRRRPVFGRKA